MVAVRLRSAIPGRTRWEVAAIEDRTDRAIHLSALLRRQPDITYSFANPLTGRVLLRYPATLSTRSVEAILRDALPIAIARADDDERARALAALSGHKPPPPRPMPIASLLRGHRREVIAAMGYTLLSELFLIIYPVSFGLLIEFVSRAPQTRPRGFRTKLLALTTINVAALTLETAARYAGTVRWKRLAQTIQHQLRVEAHNRIQMTEFSFREKVHTGKLINYLQSDIHEIGLLGIEALVATDIVFWTIVANGALVVLLPPVAAFNLLLVPIAGWAVTYAHKQSKLHYELASEVGAELSEQISSTLGGMSTTASFAAEDYEAQRVARASYSFLETSQRAMQSSEGASVPVQWLFWLGVGVNLYVGGVWTMTGRMPLSVYFSLIAINKRMLWFLRDLGLLFDHHRRVTGAAQRIYELIDTWPAVKDGARTLARASISGDVRFTDVAFAYDQGAPILPGLTLHFPARRTTAIVGSTGAGKSTLVKLLVRFYDPGSGAITIDGHDIRQLTVRSLRESIALVHQDCFLFQGTIAENIAYGEPGADRAKIEEAARAAEVAPFIESLPERYDTLVGERGTRLSGGQRQRIAIARALFADPAILVLDEATSAVDNETEAAIQRSLQRVTDRCTTIIIAHRLSTVRNADRIHVLDGGVIRESGTHDELLTAGGVYADLWRIQTGEAG